MRTAKSLPAAALLGLSLCVVPPAVLAQDSQTAETAEAAETEALRQRVAELRTRVARIEDVSAIKTLQRSFGYYLEEALWDELLTLFAEDATLEFGRDGLYRGKARIREYFQTLGEGRQGLREGELNEQLLFMPVITLAEDGASAQGRWRSIMLKGNYGEYAWWGEGPYENAYVKEDGVWKISKLHWFQTIMVPYEGGWAEHADVNGGIWVSDRLPPDAPPTIPYEPWPETFLPPFHFENPVGTYRPGEDSE